MVPHATELLFALGLGDRVIGVTHECDYPEAARRLPKITADRLSPGGSAAEIDAAVRERVADGEAIYALDEDALHGLAPDLIVTQSLCPVCAVSHEEVVAIAERIETCPRVIALDPHTLGETMADIRTVAQATGAEQAALDLLARQGHRIDAVRRAVAEVAEPPGVAAIEWFDPVYVAGHWTPQLIELAGGVDVLGFTGEPSQRSTWDAVAAARPDVVVCIPCGYDAARSLEEARLHADQLATIGARRIVALDASAYFSRPGPRLVDGLETLAHALHPELVAEAPGVVHELRI